VARVMHSYRMDYPYSDTIAIGLMTLSKRKDDNDSSSSPLFVVELRETVARDIQLYFEELKAIDHALSEIGIAVQCITPGKIRVKEEDDENTLSIDIGDKNKDSDSDIIDRRRLNLFLIDT
jgi:hypothetical protein